MHHFLLVGIWATSAAWLLLLKQLRTLNLSGVRVQPLQEKFLAQLWSSVSP